MKKTSFKILPVLLFFSVISGSKAQSISPTNTEGNKSLPCWSCQPANWFNFGGTPDMSNRTNAAASGTTGGGNAWTSSPLPLPPNGHTYWITIRDIGNQGVEESVGTNISGLTPGREYEIVAYSLTARAAEYSPQYIEKFDFQIGTYPRVNVTAVKRDTDASWGTSRLKFTADAPSMQLAFYPGNNAANSSSFESVNISVTLNAINTIPVVQEKSAFTEKNTPVEINLFTDALDYDPGQNVLIQTLDLNPSLPGIQNAMTTSEGTWTINHSTGILVFNPALDFTGTAVIPYTIQDNYILDGIASPGTSTPKNITITIVEEVCTEPVAGESFSLEDGETITFNQPATNYGFQFDIYTLDNSFNMEINGVQLATQEIQFQSDSTSGINIRFADGSQYEQDTEDIWQMTGNSAAPIIRVNISPTGVVSMFGSKTSGGPLEALELFNGNQFNTILWNSSSQNTITATQSVTGVTYMTGYGSGLNVVPCFCLKPGASGSVENFSSVGILTSSEPTIDGWPLTVPNGHLVLDAAHMGMVITHMNNAQRDALDPVEGMLIYNTDLNCIQLYRGNNPGTDIFRTGWNCIKRGCND